MVRSETLGKPLFICGAPRSGTSATAAAFSACGIWVGRTTSQCENAEIRQNVLKPMLIAGGMDRIALRSFADVEGDPRKTRDAVAAILRNQGYPGGPWLFKDVKLVFCWRTWAEAFPDAVWATVWRPPETIVESFARWGMSKRYAFDGEEVVREHHSRAREIEGAFPLFLDHLLDGDASRYKAVAEAVGVEWNPVEVRKVVNPDRYHIAEEI